MSIENYLVDKVQLTAQNTGKKQRSCKGLFKGIAILRQYSVILPDHLCVDCHAGAAAGEQHDLLLVEAMPGYIQTASAWLEKLVEDNPVMLNYVEQYSTDIMDYVQNFAKTSLLPNINNIITGVSSSLLTMIGVAKNLIIGLIVAVYFLNSRELFCRSGPADGPCYSLPRPGRDRRKAQEKAARKLKLQTRRVDYSERRTY